MPAEQLRTLIGRLCRCFYPDGSAASFVHWKEGNVLDGASVSRDGRVTHRVKDGDGELIAYARKGDNHADSWYSQGFPYLEKLYRDGAPASSKAAMSRLSTAGRKKVIISCLKSPPSLLIGAWTLS